MKLSKRQQEVLKLMAQGWQMYRDVSLGEFGSESYLFVPRFADMEWQPNRRVAPSTADALRYMKLLRYHQQIDGRGVAFVLTPLGKSLVTKEEKQPMDEDLRAFAEDMRIREQCEMNALGYEGAPHE